MLYDVKQILFKNLDIKDIGEDSYVMVLRFIEIDVNTFLDYHRKPISITS